MINELNHNIDDAYTLLPSFLYLALLKNRCNSNVRVNVCSNSTRRAANMCSHSNVKYQGSGVKYTTQQK